MECYRSNEDELMKNTFKTLTGLAAVASISAMASFGAHAQSNQVEAKNSGFYVGGNYGYLRVEGEDDFDDDTELDADEAFDDIDDTDFETDLKQASIGVEYRF